MKTIQIIITNRAGYEKGLYGFTIGHEPGGGANVEVIESDDDLREKLLGFGVSADHTSDLTKRLKEGDKSVMIDVAAT